MLVLGHRGASALAPENTAPAFLLAIEEGADGVELDVHLTKDNQMVVAHNFELDNTSNGKGLIREHTLEELTQLDFGAWKDKKFASTKILTLRECLTLVRGMKLINIELKSGDSPYPNLVPKVCDLVSELGLINRVVLSSFNHALMKEAKDYMPQMKTGLLYKKPLLFPVAHAKKNRADALHPHYSLVTKGLLRRSQKAGIDINTWTVDSPDMAARFGAIGVHAVITNAPDVLLKALKSKASDKRQKP